jgi:hypothetical protein
MDDTSSLPTTNIINLSYDRPKIFYLKKRTDLKGKKRKDLERKTITGSNSTK